MFQSLEKNFIFRQQKCLSRYFCSELINYFETIPEKSPGYVGGVKGNSVDRKSKNSIEISLNIDEDLSPLILTLKNKLENGVSLCCENKYFSFLKDCPTWKIESGFNIQKYPPTGGYLIDHCEHGPSELFSKRILAWMIYLNDVTNGGGTKFSNQNITIKARTGDLYIWPASFTHIHRGIVSLTQTKYIATGWCSYK